MCRICGNFQAQKLPSLNGTQPDAWTLASLTLAPAKNGGKLHHFGVYLIRGLFDTPENRVVTSGLTLASILEAFWAFNPTRGALNPRKNGHCLDPQGNRSGISY